MNYDTLKSLCGILNASERLKRSRALLGGKIALGTPEHMILSLLYEKKPIPVSVWEIKQITSLSAPSLSRIVSRLSKKWYIRRTVPSEIDSRKIMLLLTDTGKLVFEEVMSAYLTALNLVPLSKETECFLSTALDGVKKWLDVFIK